MMFSAGLEDFYPQRTTNLKRNQDLNGARRVDFELWNK